MTVLATSVEHHLTMYHRSSVTTLFYPSPTQAQWEKRPFTGYPANLNNYADAIIGNAVAFPGTASIQTNSGPATVPTLDLFAIRSNGTLIEGASNPDASGNWRNCDLNPSCPAAAGCTSGGGFSWLFDPAHDHSVSGAPAILDDQVGFSVNGPSVSNCSDHDLLNTIAPQWVSPQRQNSAYKDQEFHGTPLIQGYNDDVPTEVEGVVVDSHIAAIDTPINHTHGKSTDWPLVHHDWNVIVAPDVKYQNMLTDANMLEGGVMEMEWEAADHIGCDQFDDDGDCTHQALFSPVDNPPTVSEDQRAAFTADAFPSIGDRVAIRGRFIFDCGHPPYRAELHPIDAIAVIHNSEYAKVRYSENGGSQWYQPADVNLASSSDAKCSLNQKLQDLGAGLIPQPNVSGFGPLDDTLDTIEKVVEAIGVYEFGTGCFRHYDPTLISPQTLGKDGYSNTCYNTYEGPMINLFSESTTPKTADPPFFPLSFSPATAFTFTVPGGPQITPVFNNHSGATTRVYTNGTVGQSLDICFQRQALKSHDTVDHGIQLCIPDVNCCDDDTTEELVTWITVNGLSRLYVEGGDNCLPVAVYPDDTLTIGSHGFECDLSCAEHWDDPEAANATDDRIGSIKIAFTADQNWGLPGTDLGGHTYSGTYTVKTQPDLGTHRSRDLSAGDYQMTISVVPTVVIADQQGGSP
jgi:hypothetical protein